jgi:hypothetical protein
VQRILRARIRRTSRGELIEPLEADIDYYHDRGSLLRAKLYPQGLRADARLQELEASLESARRRLREERSRAEP